VKILSIAVLLFMTSCSMGLRYDSQGEFEGFTKLSKVSLEDQK